MRAAEVLLCNAKQDERTKWESKRCSVPCGALLGLALAHAWHRVASVNALNNGGGELDKAALTTLL